MKLSSMQYYGGKSANGGRGIGKWITSLLPYPGFRHTYVEPFAGMCGILLQRPRAYIEIINDLDGQIYNWWRVVRDNGEELARRLQATPHSREEFQNCCQTRFTDQDPVERARAFTVVLLGGLYHSERFRMRYNPQSGEFPTPIPFADKIPALAKRLAHVQVENRDALKLLDRVRLIKDSVIYCDPPYIEADHSAYRYDVDRAKMADVLRQCQGYVAVSGYADEWDHLGWTRHTFDTFHQALYSDGRGGENRKKRTEVLWTNYGLEHCGGRLLI